MAQYCFAFFLPANALFHAIKYGNKAKIELLLFLVFVRQGVDENERDVLQVLSATWFAKEVFHKLGITLAQGTHQVLEMLIHAAKVVIGAGKEMLAFQAVPPPYSNEAKHAKKRPALRQTCYSLYLARRLADLLRLFLRF